MYEILCRSAERPFVLAHRAEPAAPSSSSSRLVLHMRENRSHLSKPARECISLVAIMLMALSILPALSGHWLVPAYCLMAMGGLVFALDHHARSIPAGETLEIGDGHVSHRDAQGRATQLPCHLTRLHADAPTPASLRLILRAPRGSVEIGRCLGADERRALVPVIAAALAQARR